MQPLSKLSNIKRNYGAIKALRGVNFEIMPGEVMGLVVENGTGKSTMVKIISGFVSDPAASFGGTKHSGLGREGGHEGMLEFTETQYISASW